MADAHVVEFAVFQSAGDAVVKTRAAAAAEVDGLVEQYAGVKVEDATESVHVTIWRAAGARDAFAAAQEGGGAGQNAPLLVEALAVPAADGPDLTAALEAPTTEGSVVLETAEDVAPGAAAVQAAPQLAAWAGPAVKLLIGWTSREAHLAAKDKAGPIRENIGLVREGRNAGIMYHVKLQKL